MLDEERMKIQKKFPDRILNLDATDFENDDEAARQRTILENGVRLIVSEKAAEIFKIMERYNLPMENVNKILISDLGVSEDVADMVLYRYKIGHIR